MDDKGNLAKYLKDYEEANEEAIKEDHDAYSSFRDFLGANAMKQCDCCDQVFEYDELNEGGECWECSQK